MPASGFAPLVVCPNPDHNTTKRHFQINLDQPTVHCFAGCGISGTYEKAIAMIEGCTEKEARKIIREQTSVDLGKPELRKKGRKGVVATVDENSLDYDSYVPEVAVEYLASRGIDSNAIARWLIGWDASTGRIVIPAHDANYRRKFLIKRAVKEKDWPKYLYSDDSEKTSILFGACNFDLKLVESQGIVLVEGSLDTIVQHSNGIRNTGGILGTYLSERQAQIISSYRPPCVFLLFDKDAAGYNALRHAEKRLVKEKIKVCLYPKGKSDPAQFTREEAEHAVGNAVSMVKFNRRVKEVKPGQRRRIDGNRIQATSDKK
jgi:DNA primase